jgi:16S rRNA (adenine1518-N6/adenine1519-N6)-dimethyltransferase
MINFRIKKKLGQHFLFDTSILERIVKAASICPEDAVVEIGAGHGRLTGYLADSAKRVVAIEIDRQFHENLKKLTLEKPNIEIVQADALKFRYDTIGRAFKVVGNIPYYVTTPILFKLLDYRHLIESMTIMVQQEVAERIVASPGNKDYGALSIALQSQTIPSIAFKIPAGAFRPRPKVNSAVVVFQLPKVMPYSIEDYSFFMKTVKAAFQQRRKTIQNSLKGFLNVKEALRLANIEPTIRPERLGIEDFIALVNQLKIQENETASATAF